MKMLTFTTRTDSRVSRLFFHVQAPSQDSATGRESGTARLSVHAFVRFSLFRPGQRFIVQRTHQHHTRGSSCVWEGYGTSLPSWLTLKRGGKVLIMTSRVPICPEAIAPRKDISDSRIRNARHVRGKPQGMFVSIHYIHFFALSLLSHARLSSGGTLIPRISSFSSSICVLS